MSNIFRKILVTCALPYANGSIHIGHMLEHIQADIWVRYHKMCGHEVWFVSADDAHGTAIMLKSENLGISSNNLIKQVKKEHEKDFLNFKISYDNYHSTHSIENLYLLRKIFKTLNEKGLIKEKKIFQFFDDIKEIFLPDRFIKGKCPICHAENQYGDNCEICSATYEPIELIDPISVISGKKPILKNTKHLYFDLPFFSDMLKKWIYSGVLEKSVIKKTEEWLKTGLQSWGISRDAPYFGFKIPKFPKKYFYVWLDAPIGYISAFKNLCYKNKKLNFNELWNKTSDYELYHFIGKDIIYFHTLFWPSILEAVSLRKPNGIFVHGHLTMNGLKLSKSRSIGLIKAENWIKCFDSDSLRYYYASKLSNNINDVEMNLEDFVQKINSDIVNKLVNLASRSASFLEKYFDKYLSDKLSDIKIYKYFISKGSIIRYYLENREFNLVVQESMRLIDRANQYINEKKPWKIKPKKGNNKLQEICTIGINLFRIVMVFLKPILPDLAIKTESFLISSLTWESIQNPLLQHKIKKFTPLYQRISYEKINELINLCK